MRNFFETLNNTLWYYWQRIKQSPYDLKYMFQRAIRGYSDLDSTNIDMFLTNIMPKMISKLEKNMSSYPSSLIDADLNKMTDDESEKYLEQKNKEWLQILEEIKAGFLVMRKISEGDLEFKETDNPVLKKMMITKSEQIIMDRGWELFRKHFFDFWD